MNNEEQKTKEQIVVSLCDKDFNQVAPPSTYVKDYAGGSDEYIRTDIVYKAMETYSAQSSPTPIVEGVSQYQYNDSDSLEFPSWQSCTKEVYDRTNPDYRRIINHTPVEGVSNWQEKFEALDKLVTKFGRLEAFGEDTDEYERLYNIWKPTTFSDEK